AKRPAKKQSAPSKPARKIIAENRRIPYKYHILERYEAGLELLGVEVKALREGRANLRDAYALIKGGQAWLLNCHMSPYSHAGSAAPDPLRTRKLLLHKAEIFKLAGRVEQKGLALVPTRLYLKNGRVKCELALVKGKKVWDRREELRQRITQREIDQALKRYR
ncbi:MAG: SsrA-binding protein SmpB, partial [Terriglobia bacterium]